MLFEDKKNEEFEKRQGEQNNIDKKNNELGEEAKEEREIQKYELELEVLLNKLTEKREEMKNKQTADEKEKVAKEIREIDKKIRTIQKYIAAERNKKLAKEIEEKMKLLKEITETMGIKGEEKSIELFLEKEKQLENVSDEWINKQREDLNRISEGFGFSKALVEETIYLLKESLKNEIQKIKTKDMIGLKGRSIIDIKIMREILKKSKKSEDKEKIEKIMREIEMEWLLEENKTEEFINFIDSFSKKDLFDLLIKKFQGQKITDKEKNLLHFFIVQDSEYQKEAEEFFDWFTGEIKLSLLDPDSDTATLIHEFTHKCLYELLKKADIKIREIDLINKMMIRKKTILEVENEDKKNGQDCFFKAENALDESLAHKMSTYYGLQRNPFFENYKGKTSPELFKEIYDSINDATKEKSLEEFCEIAKDLYLSFAKKWDIDLTTTDVEKAIQDLKKEIENSK